MPWRVLPALPSGPGISTPSRSPTGCPAMPFASARPSGRSASIRGPAAAQGAARAAVGPAAWRRGRAARRPPAAQRRLPAGGPWRAAAGGGGRQRRSRLADGGLPGAQLLVHEATYARRRSTRPGRAGATAARPASLLSPRRRRCRPCCSLISVRAIRPRRGFAVHRRAASGSRGLLWAAICSWPSFRALSPGSSRPAESPGPERRAEGWRTAARKRLKRFGLV